MKRLLLFVIAATLVGISGCSGQEKDTPKPVAIDNPQAQEKDPPKIIVTDSTKPAVTNSIGMKFVWIPPGSFVMGSPKEEKERGANETQHKVTLSKGFYMGVYTVTQEQYQAVMGKNPSFFKGEKNLPVETVSWDDCQEFIKKLRDKDKKLYRLPTEAEWEYSCRAGTTTAYYFGDDKSVLGDVLGQYAWFPHNSEMKTHPVGQKKPNQWGLYDMHGNVHQWCQDVYGEYPQKDVVDPTGAEKSEFRVLRGGSYGDHPMYCRSACRGRWEPGQSGGTVGCRLCFFVD